MERLLTLIAALVAAVATMLPPAVVFSTGWHSLRSILATECEINARLVSGLINDNPELWRMAVPRLQDLLSRRLQDKTAERRFVLDAQGRLVAEVADELAAPRIAQSMPVHDAGHVVGSLHIERSLRPLLLSTSLAALAGLALGGAVFFVLKLLPLRVLRRANERLRHEATHDALTGLPNRLLFMDRLEQAEQRARGEVHCLALLFVDLDHFKDVNDELGHAAGDQLLQQVAARLTTSLDRLLAEPAKSGLFAHTAARLGGDEFTVVAECTDARKVSALAEQLLAALAEPMMLGTREHRVKASIGIAIATPVATTPGQLLRHADMAMYRAKQQGRHGYAFFDEQLNRATQERIALEQALQGALERGEFELHYQPKAELSGGRITGAEALLRWRRPHGGLISPDRFIALLEDNGLIVPVGRWVVAQALAQLKRWDEQGMAGLTMAVNLSPRQFRDGELVGHVQQALADAGVAPARLELELTEGLLMEDNAFSREVLNRLGALGVRVAIDDFGTGYSSLAYLKRFKVDTLKLDRSFMRDMPGDHENQAIASAVVALAHSLKLAVVCEGVETVAQRDFLRALGCDGMQGYWLSPPMPAELATGWLKTHMGVRAGGPTPPAAGAVAAAQGLQLRSDLASHLGSMP